jgi:hypothetical protein
VHGKTLRWLVLAMTSAVVSAAAMGSRVAAQEEEYALFFRFEVPPAIPGLTIIQDEPPLDFLPVNQAPQGTTKRTTNGTLRGTLGGLAVVQAAYTFITGVGNHAGSGTFTLSTKAGAVEKGRILMTSEGQKMTLLFLGAYLGNHLSFSLVGDSTQFGGTDVVMTGLAETDFSSHERYAAAIRAAIATLPGPVQQEILAQADQNPRLVRDYQQRPPAP